MELTKPCPNCSHNMEIVEREREDKIEPIRQWECLCGHHEPLSAAKDWGEA